MKSLTNRGLKKRKSPYRPQFVSKELAKWDKAADRYEKIAEKCFSRIRSYIPAHEDKMSAEEKEELILSLCKYIIYLYYSDMNE